jgi:hypothetical protein
MAADVTEIAQPMIDESGLETHGFRQKASEPRFIRSVL